MSRNEEIDREIGIWKVRRLVKRLQLAKGNGTSMITLMLTPKERVSRTQQMLTEESGTASNIKSRVNRQSVQAAIASVQARLRLYASSLPKNGLMVFCGSVLTDEGKEKLVNIDFEPFKPVANSVYHCDNKFHTQALEEMLSDDEKYGFIVMDGNGCLFGTVQGNTRDVLHKFDVDLPKKHGRGGQSAVRFARLRSEKRHNYIRKVAEMAKELFIRNDKVTVEGLVLAGSASFKTELASNNLFDQRLQAKVVKIVDVGYGGENGFKQAVELAAPCLASVKLIFEMKLIASYFDEIKTDSGKYVYGVKNTMTALQMGVVETLICWDGLEAVRFKFKNQDGVENVDYLSSRETAKSSEGREFVDAEQLIDWLVENYQTYAIKLEIVTDKSHEGRQFAQGFGGIGAILRYRADVPLEDETSALDDLGIDLSEY